MIMRLAPDPTLFRLRPPMLLLLGLLATSADALEIAAQVTTQPIDRAGEWDFRQDGRGGLWLGYYDLSRALHLRDPQGQDRNLIQADERKAQSGLAMATQEAGVSLLWREKFPVKKFLLHDSNRPEAAPVELGADSEPLTRLQANYLQGQLQLLWYGERGYPELQEKNFIYTQAYDPVSGQASPSERLTAGIYPVWAHDAGGNTLVFSWVADAEGSRVIARRRLAEAKEFDPAVTLAAVPPISHIFRALEANGQWFAFWATSRGDEQRLEGAVSVDLGQTWRHFSLEALGNFIVSSLDVAADGEGRVFLALSGKDLATPGAKQDIRLIRSADRGETWQVSRPRPESVAQRFRGRNPSVEIGPAPGQVLLVWEDWRHLRGQLFLSLSQDGGATWAIDNLAMPQPAGINRTLTDALSAVYVQDQSYHVLAQQPVDDSIGAYHLYDVGFSLADLQQLADSDRQTTNGAPNVTAAPGTSDQVTAPVGTADEGQPISEPAEPVRERVAAFWKALETGDFAGAYEFQDPFFRAKNSKLSYTQPMGRIKYRDLNIDEITIDGPIAKVKTRVKASVIPFRAKTGEMITRPEQEVKVDETWLWLDGNWYREYYSEANDLKFTRY